MKKMISLLLAICMILAFGSSLSFAAPDSSDGLTPFAEELESKYIDPDRIYSTDSRWWLSAGLTSETMMEEIQAMYDGGFRGVELCMQSDGDAAIFGYGGAEWSFKWKLMMNKLLDLGMGVYLTSGTNWSTSNVPGLNPDSQDTMQVVAQGALHTVAAGATLNGQLNAPSTFRTRATFLGAYAYLQTANNVADYDSIVDLSSFVTGGPVPGGIADTGADRNRSINWTAPADPAGGSWRVYGLWMQGSYQSASPAVTTSYATNYFDLRGVEALRKYWEANYLNEPELNAKILKGNVQVFMDSIEANPSGGITFWAEDMRQEFIARKGYDILPYIFLLAGVSNGSFWSNTYTAMPGTVRLAGDNEILRQRIVSDYLDVQTQVYNERMLKPLTEWLNSVGIKTRAQYSYGKAFEMSEPGMYLDLIDTENRVKMNQVDYFRNWAGAAKLQNKLFSTESGAQSTSIYRMNRQLNLRDAYSQYAAGVQNMVWHIWGAEYGSGTSVAWPGAQAGMSGFQRFGNREPQARDYDEFNAHLGRVQQFVQTGKARSDIGFISNKWVMYLTDSGEGTTTPTTPANINRMNWQFAHQGIFYRSTELQDNGYTYDYFSPKFLFDDHVYFNEETKTIELAGYKALVLYQEWLDVEGAARILDWASKGLPVVVLGGAASRTPFNDGKDAELAAIMTQLKALPNVRTATVANYENYFAAQAVGYEDNVMEMLQELGVYPYAEFVQPNHQLLTQTRIDDDDNLYLYVFNYCPNTYHRFSHIDSVKTEDHGLNIKTEIKMDGLFIPYVIDAWTGYVTQLANYRYEDGKTVFPIDLDFDNIALFAFEAVDKQPLHIVSTDAQSAYATTEGLFVRATESGAYNTVLSNGATYLHDFTVPAPYDVTGWDVTVESWTRSSATGSLRRTEPQIANPSVMVTNSKTPTIKTDIPVTLDKMTTWNNMPGVGNTVSGTANYKATFYWDADKADGAYLNLGENTNFYGSMKVWINGQKVGGDVSTNPTKVQRSVGIAIDGEIPAGRILYTGGVSDKKPVADIGAYLVDGVNTIEIDYSSDLTNIAFSYGLGSATIAIYNWYNHVAAIRAYGPSQAIIVPYVETPLETIVLVDICADQPDVIVNNQASFTVSLEDAKGVGTVELSFTFSDDVFDKDSITVTPCSGFDPGLFPRLSFEYLGSGIWKGTVKYMYPGYVKGDAPLDILKISGTVIDNGPATITLTGIEVQGDNGSGLGIMPGQIRTAEATVTVGGKPAKYSKYDLNKDGSIDETDLLYLIYFYQWNDRDPGWAVDGLYGVYAKDCDFQVNGKVDLADMIELTANYGLYDPYAW